MLVELALLLPLLLTMALGVADLGFAIRSDLTVTQATRSGARTAASVGSVDAADYQIIRSVAASSQSLVESEIERIVIYRATTDAGDVPEACLSTAVGAGVAGSCNVYGPEAFSAPEACFAAATCAGIDPDPWPAAARVTSQAGAGPDFLGVHLVYRQASIMPLFPWSEYDISSSTVMRLEPGP